MGEVIWTRTRPSGITIRKTREPFGVVAVVFESRPNVFVDTAALCLKTGNAIILRGGKEAVKSNAALAQVVRAALAEHSSALSTGTPLNYRNKVVYHFARVDAKGEKWALGYRQEPGHEIVDVLDDPLEVNTEI